MLDNPVVVHFTDGHTLSGYGEDLRAGDDEILLRDAVTEEDVTVNLRQVKVVCFVRDLFSTGIVRNREAPPVRQQSLPGRRVEIVFRDGERLDATADLAEPPTRGFFAVPLNPQANSVKLYVNPAAIVSFRFVT